MNETESVVLIVMFSVMGVMLAGVVIAQIVACWLASKSLAALPQQFREIEPALVWLLMIPCFAMIWNYFVFPKIAFGYQRFFRSLGRERPDDCGALLSFWYCLSVCCWVLPLVMYVAFPASYVLLIILLVKISRLRREAEELVGRPLPESARPMLPAKKVDPANPYA